MLNVRRWEVGFESRHEVGFESRHRCFIFIPRFTLPKWLDRGGDSLLISITTLKQIA